MGMFLGLIIGGAVTFVFYKMTMPSGSSLTNILEDPSVQGFGIGCLLTVMYGSVFLASSLIIAFILDLIGIVYFL